MAQIDHGDARQPGNADYFTGEVYSTVLSEPADPDGVRVINVEFTAGARSKWHSHPGGQVLHVISGEGLVANEEGQCLAMRPGDTVTVAPGELHWHGATPSSPMLQMSITSHGAAEWTGVEIGDEEYRDAVESAG